MIHLKQKKADGKRMEKGTIHRSLYKLKVMKNAAPFLESLERGAMDGKGGKGKPSMGLKRNYKMCVISTYMYPLYVEWE
jgi:hypothetical protein